MHTADFIKRDMLISKHHKEEYKYVSSIEPWQRKHGKTTDYYMYIKPVINIYFSYSILYLLLVYTKCILYIYIFFTIRSCKLSNVGFSVKYILFYRL